MNSKVDWYFNKAGKWQKEIKELRSIILDTQLAEDLKWGCPCYTFEGSNIVLIHVFKDYCAVLFFKGVLLKDPKKVLIQQTENVQAARQMRFTSVEEVKKHGAALKAYIFEAVQVEEKGLKVPMKKTRDFAMPEEFQNRLDEDPELKAAFEALTPGRQRAYLFHFGEAKLSKTRAARVQKAIPQILEGKGLDD
ncbi:MAG TPA: YdeI/OmpD-associated family protein [Chitinophagaceae bacterium]|nr:YdeI/OmpD-associated family protein [Chitinophagaceae bacterium]